MKGIFQQLFQNKANDIFREPQNGGIGLAKCQQLFGTQDPAIFLARLSDSNWLNQYTSFINVR